MMIIERGVEPRPVEITYSRTEDVIVEHNRDQAVV